MPKPLEINLSIPIPFIDKELVILKELPQYWQYLVTSQGFQINDGTDRQGSLVCEASALNNPVFRKYLATQEIDPELLKPGDTIDIVLTEQISVSLIPENPWESKKVFLKKGGEEQVFLNEILR